LGISIRYVRHLTEQLHKLGFYSNSVDLPIGKLAELLDAVSDTKGFSATAVQGNENALKLASFHTGRKKVIAFRNSFHGRTSASLNITDNPKISAPINLFNFPVTFIDLNNPVMLTQALAANDVCAVIVEGIQGVGGLDMPDDAFLRFLSETCHAHGTLLILDEIQSGYGRSGKFFAHQHAGIKPDLITVAKGMGNGLPIAGLLIAPQIEAKIGML
jgi:acetylornithine aminotransferase